MSKRQRRWLVWANVLLAAGFLVWYFGAAALFMVETRYVGWKFPEVVRVPVELGDLSVAQGAGRTLSYFGYEFEAPWDDVDEAKGKQVGKVQLIAFRSDKAILFSRMAPKEFVTEFLTNTKINPRDLRALYGEEALQSDYALHRLILEATPGKINLLTPRQEAVGNAMLLVMKGIMVPGRGETEIYRVRTEKFQGFQFGDPKSRPKSVNIEMYAKDGGLSFIFVQREKGNAEGITQAEINRVIRTARRAPDEN